MADDTPKTIEWSDKLCIDNGIIDEDHKYLIELCNEFIKNHKRFDSRDQAHELINNLLDYTATHFRREENLQEQIGFPDIVEHKKAHSELENNLHEIMYLIRDAKNSDLDLVSTKAISLIRKWLVGHILKHDMPMREYVEKLRNESTDISPIQDITLL